MKNFRKVFCVQKILCDVTDCVISSKTNEVQGEAVFGHQEN